LPDTNAWIHFLNPQPSSVKTAFSRYSADKIFLCDIVKAELYFGAYKSTRREQNLDLIKQLDAGFPSIPFDGNAANIFGKIRADLAKVGTPIGPYDLQIAAIALSRNFTLITHNTREFLRVADLRLEDWEA
jgi:tRNA(fMet)-specific endonuclease VapC